HGIQALDLLGRKVVMNGGAGLMLLARKVNATIERAMSDEALHPFATALAQALQKLGAATKAAWASGVPEEALANAVPYMQAFGHVVLAWVWLDVALASGTDSAAGQGRHAACRFFFRHELPRTEAWLAVVRERDDTCLMMQEEWF
ncbi:MAG: hypothetical protein RLZZ373_3314, partial [Pseudomonadota bacterium]